MNRLSIALLFQVANGKIRKFVLYLQYLLSH